jgi:hypothetical protein
MRPYKVTVGHAVTIDKDQVLSCCLPDSLIQDSRFPEANILLPDMLYGKDSLQHITHLINRIPCFRGASIVSDKYL